MASAAAASSLSHVNSDAIDGEDEDVRTERDDVSAYMSAGQEIERTKVVAVQGLRKEFKKDVNASGGGGCKKPPKGKL